MSSVARAKQTALNAHLKELLKKYRRKDRHHTFHEPVPRDTPMYYETIKNPMDFSTMETKLRRGRYSSLDEFDADYRLIMDNCKYFNDPSTIYWAQADMMQKYGRDVMAKTRPLVEQSLESIVRQAEKEAADKAAASAPTPGSNTFMLPLTGMGTATPVPPPPPPPPTPEPTPAPKSRSSRSSMGGAAAAAVPTDPVLDVGFASVVSGGPVAPQSLFHPQHHPSSAASPALAVLASSPTGQVAHPASLPDRDNPMVWHPWNVYFPQSTLGQATATQLSNTPSTQLIMPKTKGKNQYSAKMHPLGKVRKDIRLISGPGVENNFNMGLHATNMDLITIWEREQELWKQTGENALQRDEQECWEGLGPLSYAEYRPTQHVAFDHRSIQRLEKFVQQGTIGELAANEIGLTTTTTTTTSKEPTNNSLTTNVYSHLLKESSIHVKKTQQWMKKTE